MSPPPPKEREGHAPTLLWEGSWEARWGQNETEDAPKSISKTKTKQRALEDRLGAVLGRSWVDLGTLRSPKSCCGPRGARFFEKSRFSTEEASRSDLESNLGRFEGSRGSKMEAAEGPIHELSRVKLGSENGVKLKCEKGG